jgi:hypothetical protein
VTRASSRLIKWSRFALRDLRLNKLPVRDIASVSFGIKLLQNFATVKIVEDDIAITLAAKDIDLIVD